MLNKQVLLIVFCHKPPSYIHLYLLIAYTFYLQTNDYGYIDYQYELFTFYFKLIPLAVFCIASSCRGIDGRRISQVFIYTRRLPLRTKQLGIPEDRKTTV